MGRLGSETRSLLKHGEVLVRKKIEVSLPGRGKFLRVNEH